MGVLDAGQVLPCSLEMFSAVVLEGAPTHQLLADGLDDIGGAMHAALEIEDPAT